MILAADYPFLNIFWTMILFFFWIAWISVLVTIIGDVFRRHDVSGWIKAMWVAVLIFIPFLGVLGYLIVNGTDMSERQYRQVEARQARFASSTNGGGGAASEIGQAKSLLDSGAITESEFASLKAKALA
jgi:uncharacterized membrane protein YcjF (UPF0283 family)